MGSPAASPVRSEPEGCPDCTLPCYTRGSVRVVPSSVGDTDKPEEGAGHIPVALGLQLQVLRLYLETLQ